MFVKNMELCNLVNWRSTIELIVEFLAKQHILLECAQYAVSIKLLKLIVGEINIIIEDNEDLALVLSRQDGETIDLDEFDKYFDKRKENKS